MSVVVIVGVSVTGSEHLCLSASAHVTPILQQQQC